MEIADNIQHLKQSLPAHVRIVAVSKTVPEADILEAYHCGHRIFGENRVKELTRKQANLPRDIEWHMIGHLQTNKVKYIAPFISMIHSVDNLNLLSVIHHEALRNNRIIRCLLQIRIAKEETKYGLSPDAAVELLSTPEFQILTHVRICGLMGMATFTSDAELIRSEFHFLAGLFSAIKTRRFHNDEAFSELSMGMSGDYSLAIEEGATLLRIGTLIFGQRT